MAFHEIRFPADLSFGSSGGPERRTQVVTLTNGHEERSTPWAHSIRRYDAGAGLRSMDDVERLLAFFEARMGRLHGFRWKDWADHRSAPPSEAIGAGDQILGTGDGMRTEFALVKAYASGTWSYERPIAKPVAGTVIVAIAGAPVDPDRYGVDATTGIVRFDEAPRIDAPVTAGFEFDVPVRFDTDAIQTSLAAFGAGEVPIVPVVEVRT